MATNKTNINITELDFDNIKDNFKAHLEAQSEFNDYDFEGSGLNILMDLLSILLITLLMLLLLQLYLDSIIFM